MTGATKVTVCPVLQAAADCWSPSASNGAARSPSPSSGAGFESADKTLARAVTLALAAQQAGLAAQQRAEVNVESEDETSGGEPEGEVPFLPQGAYRAPLLECMMELGGEAPVEKIRAAMERKMASRLGDGDRALLASGAVRWWNFTQWNRQNLVHEGLFRADSPRGVWTLSDKGKTSKIEARIASNSSTKRRDETERVFRIHTEKLQQLDMLLPHLKAVRRFFDISAKTKAVYLQIDDLYHLRRADQAFVVDYIHRLCKDVPLYFKIATIRHASTLYVDREGQPIGAQERHDYQPINIDYTFNDFQVTRKQNWRILLAFGQRAGLTADRSRGGVQGRRIFSSRHGGRRSSARCAFAISRSFV